MAGRFFQKGGLVQAFKNSLALDDASKRQLKAGLAVTAAGYAALGVLCAVDPNASYMLIKQFSWQQAPFHALFVMGTNLLGAAGMAGYDRYVRKNTGQETDAAPQPKARP